MRRVLVVDDDPYTRLAIGKMTQALRVQGCHHGCGETGLAARSDRAFEPAIVDAFIPDMRGFGADGMLHGHAQTIPLIPISGFAGLENDDQ